MPRLLGSIIGVSGILGHRPARWRQLDVGWHSRGALRPRFAGILTPSSN